MVTHPRATVRSPLPTHRRVSGRQASGCRSVAPAIPHHTLPPMGERPGEPNGSRSPVDFGADLWFLPRDAGDRLERLSRSQGTPDRQGRDHRGADRGRGARYPRGAARSRRRSQGDSGLRAPGQGEGPRRGREGEGTGQGRRRACLPGRPLHQDLSRRARGADGSGRAGPHLGQEGPDQGHDGGPAGLGEDHHGSEARPAPQERGQEGPARRRRHLPPGCRRPAPAARCPPRGPRLPSARHGAPRALRGRPGAGQEGPRRRGHLRHRRPPGHR